MPDPYYVNGFRRIVDIADDAVIADAVPPRTIIAAHRFAKPAGLRKSSRFEKLNKPAAEWRIERPKSFISGSGESNPPGHAGA